MPRSLLVPVDLRQAHQLIALRPTASLNVGLICAGPCTAQPKDRLFLVPQIEFTLCDGRSTKAAIGESVKRPDVLTRDRPQPRPDLRCGCLRQRADDHALCAVLLSGTRNPTRRKRSSLPRPRRTMQPVLVHATHQTKRPTKNQNKHPQPAIQQNAPTPSSGLDVPRGTLDPYSVLRWLYRPKSPKSVPCKYILQKFGV